jgi:TPR repeat protein
LLAVIQQLRAYTVPVAEVSLSPAAGNSASFWQAGKSSSSSGSTTTLSSAQAELLYEAGTICEQAKRYPQAAVCYEQAAQQGHVKAKTGLAMLYLQERIDNASKSIAHGLLLSAAKGGHGRAMQNVARQFEKGDGVEANAERACFWYKKVAEVTGDKRASKKYQSLSMFLSGSSGASVATP